MNENPEIKMGNLVETWGGTSVKNITFCVTEDCNLCCKYCYMSGKNSKNKLTLDIAKRAVDCILSNREFFNEEGVIWDFIGGEPFIEIDLIDKITDYIKTQMFILEHPWFDKYRLSFSSNGLLYDTPAVQNYIKKNNGHVSIGLSVDGNKIKHDLQRVKIDGTGSYDDVIKNVPLWLKQFPNAQTKATFSHDDLPYLKESIISLWDLGIKNVAANVVYENVWQDGDDKIFENQLIGLADYIIENKLWYEYSVRFFDHRIGFPLVEEDLCRNHCGAGTMLAIDYKGDFYPCIRFLDFSLSNRPGLKIGDINNGINKDKLRPFYALTLKDQSKEECINCEVASGCAWCTGFNYDFADTDTIYQRADGICKMHKANVRANKYFWSKFETVTALKSPRDTYALQRIIGAGVKQRYLIFILSNNSISFCNYDSHNKHDISMSQEILQKGISFALEKCFLPILLHSDSDDITIDMNSINFIGSKSRLIDIDKNKIVVYEEDVIMHDSTPSSNCIIKINKTNRSNLFDYVKSLYKDTKRINIILQDLELWEEEDIKDYEIQLDKIIELIFDSYNIGSKFEVNVLTDSLYLHVMDNCGAGENTFALGPNGKFYICPAFYFENPDNHIGDLENGITIKNPQLLNIDKSPLCSKCDTYHCKRCKYLNKKLTGEINIPSHIQCVVSHIEKKKSKRLQLKLREKGLLEDKTIITDNDYLDPIELIIKKGANN